MLMYDDTDIGTIMAELDFHALTTHWSFCGCRSNTCLATLTHISK